MDKVQEINMTSTKKVKIYVKYLRYYIIRRQLLHYQTRLVYYIIRKKLLHCRAASLLHYQVILLHYQAVVTFSGILLHYQAFLLHCQAVITVSVVICVVYLSLYTAGSWMIERRNVSTQRWAQHTAAMGSSLLRD